MAAGRRIVQVNPMTSQRTVLATFILDGEQVSATWDVPTYRDSLVVATGTGGAPRFLEPEDGRAFWDALPASVATSTILTIEEFTPDTEPQTGGQHG